MRGTDCSKGVAHLGCFFWRGATGWGAVDSRELGAQERAHPPIKFTLKGFSDGFWADFSEGEQQQGNRCGCKIINVHSRAIAGVSVCLCPPWLKSVPKGVWGVGFGVWNGLGSRIVGGAGVAGWCSPFAEIGVPLGWNRIPGGGGGVFVPLRWNCRA